MTTPQWLLGMLLALAVLNLFCLVALVVLVIVPAARTRVQDRKQEGSANAEWSSVDLLPRG